MFDVIVLASTNQALSSKSMPEQVLVDRAQPTVLDRFVAANKTVDAVGIRPVAIERDLLNLVTAEWMEFSMILFALIVFILVRRSKR